MLRPQRGVLAPTLGDADGARRARKPVTDNLDNSDNLVNARCHSKDHPGSCGRGDPHSTHRPEGRFLRVIKVIEVTRVSGYHNLHSSGRPLSLPPVESTPYRGLMI